MHPPTLKSNLANVEAELNRIVKGVRNIAFYFFMNFKFNSILGSLEFVIYKNLHFDWSHTLVQ